MEELSLIDSILEALIGFCPGKSSEIGELVKCGVCGCMRRFGTDIEKVKYNDPFDWELIRYKCRDLCTYLSKRKHSQRR
jgi:hypothetical protein